MTLLLDINIETIKSIVNVIINKYGIIIIFIIAK
jgi:hypothetical protein